MDRIRLFVTSLACLACLAPMGRAEDLAPEMTELDADYADGESDPRAGLRGEFSAGLLYSDDFGVTGSARLKYGFPADPGRWVSAAADLAEKRRSGRFVFHQENAIGGGALEVVVFGDKQEARDSLPFSTSNIGGQLRLSWQDVGGGTLGTWVGHARNRIENPDPGLSPLIVPDLGERNRNMLGADYVRSFSLDGAALSRIRLRGGLEYASVSDGRDQWRGELSMLAGGQFGESVTWRGDIRVGAVTTSGGASSIGERYMLGSASLRGFEYAGFGPRDGDTALGGNRFTVARFDLVMPRAFGAESWVMPGLHADFGALWGLDNTDGGRVDDRAHMRSSVGLTLSARFEHGSVSLNLSRALDKQDGDRVQQLQLNMQTRF